MSVIWVTEDNETERNEMKTFKYTMTSPTGTIAESPIMELETAKKLIEIGRNGVGGDSIVFELIDTTANDECESIEKEIFDICNSGDSLAERNGINIYSKRALDKMEQLSWDIYHIRMRTHKPIVMNTPPPQIKYW